MSQKVSTSSQKAARSSSRSVKETFFETDPETAVMSDTSTGTPNLFSLMVQRY